MNDEVSLASFGKRSFAFLIDELIVSFLIIVIFYNQILNASTPALLLAKRL